MTHNTEGCLDACTTTWTEEINQDCCSVDGARDDAAVDTILCVRGPCNQIDHHNVAFARERSIWPART